MHRRTYLAAAGSALAAVAGCLTGATSDGRGSRTTFTPAPDAAETIALDADGPGTWPQVGHDARHHSYAPGASGPGTDASPKVAWQALGSRSVYPPMVDSDLYLTERWTGGAALSLASADGATRWTNMALPPMRWAPALARDRMLVLTRTESNTVRLHALATDTGEQQWAQAEGVTASTTSRPPSGPTVRDGTVYVGSSTGVIALDVATGTLRWEAKLGEHVIETENGPTWRTDWVKPAVSAERVFTFDENDSFRNAREVYAVDRQTGEQDWTATLELSDGWTLHGHVVVGRKYVFVLALDPHVRFGGDDRPWSGTQRVYALEKATGEVAWRWELTNGKLLGPPAYAQGYLFVGTWRPDADTGRVYAIDAANRTTAWTYETDAGGVHTPVVTNDAVYVTQGRELAAIGLDGSGAWRLPFEKPLSPPVVANDTVYALTGGGRSEENHVVAVRSA